ncbi:MAG TPA: enolase C-terminal domain-like protein [Burkholderiales bacterium]
MRFSIKELLFFERDVRLRMPFRFGIVTLTQAPQAFVRARIAFADGKDAWGAAAELLAPKWFDKDPALSNEQNFDQLRAALRIAREGYLASGQNTAFGHWSSLYETQIEKCRGQNLNSLTACFGPALIDRAVLDALCRALGVSFYDAIRRNLVSFAPAAAAELLRSSGLPASIAARHTVGLVDAITATDVKERVNDGLPETLEEVVRHYGHRWFKLKVGGDVAADVERLSAIAAVLDRIPEPYRASLDGNEQFEDAASVLDLLQKVSGEKRLKRLSSSILFIEQPIKRQNALASSVKALAKEKPVIIDESDDSLDAFPRARRLGYTGVSSKTCKGLYKSLLNATRCKLWNREEGAERYFMTGEDLTNQAGLALQQDLALVSLLGLKHVERNGHHYVNGMAGLPEKEQEDFVSNHPDLYERSHGAVRLKIAKGTIATKSLDCPGFASRAMPDWNAMRSVH